MAGAHEAEDALVPNRHGSMSSGALPTEHAAVKPHYHAVKTRLHAAGPSSSGGRVFPVAMVSPFSAMANGEQQDTEEALDMGQAEADTQYLLQQVDRKSHE